VVVLRCKGYVYSRGLGNYEVRRNADECFSSHTLRQTKDVSKLMNREGESRKFMSVVLRVPFAFATMEHYREPRHRAVTGPMEGYLVTSAGPVCLGSQPSTDWRATLAPDCCCSCRSCATTKMNRWKVRNPMRAFCRHQHLGSVAHDSNHLLVVHAL